MSLRRSIMTVAAASVAAVGLLGVSAHATQSPVHATQPGQPYVAPHSIDTTNIESQPAEIECSTWSSFRRCIEGKTWQLDASETTVTALRRNGELTAFFSGDRVRFDAGCNYLSAPYTLHLNLRAIHFGQVGSSMMECPTVIRDAERALAQAIGEGYVGVEPGLTRMTIKTDLGQIVMRYQQ